MKIANQKQFAAQDKHKGLRAEIFAEVAELGKLGAKFDVARVCAEIEYMDLSNVGAASVTDIVGSLFVA